MNMEELKRFNSSKKFSGPGAIDNPQEPALIEGETGLIADRLKYYEAHTDNIAIILRKIENYIDFAQNGKLTVELANQQILSLFDVFVNKVTEINEVLGTNISKEEDVDEFNINIEQIKTVFYEIKQEINQDNESLEWAGNLLNVFTTQIAPAVLNLNHIMEQEKIKGTSEEEKHEGEANDFHANTHTNTKNHSSKDESISKKDESGTNKDDINNDISTANSPELKTFKPEVSESDAIEKGHEDSGENISDGQESIQDSVEYKLLFSESDDVVKSVLKYEEFKPKHKLEIEDKTFLLSDCFKDVRDVVYGYVKDSEDTESGFQLRVYYRSLSDGGWRLNAPIGQALSKGLNNRHYTRETKLHPELEVVLNNVSYLDLENSRRNHLDIEQDTIRKNHKTKSGYKYKYYEETGQKQEAEKYDAISGLYADDMVYGGIVHRNKNNENISVDYVKGITYPDGFIPDFDKGPKRVYKTSHTIYSEKDEYGNLKNDVTIEVFSSWLDRGDGEQISIDWYIASTEQGKVWVDRIIPKDACVNSFGTYDQVNDFGLLDLKPIDYIQQVSGIPDEYKNEVYEYENIYSDITDFLAELEPVRKYKKYKETQIQSSGNQQIESQKILDYDDKNDGTEDVLNNSVEERVGDESIDGRRKNSSDDTVEISIDSLELETLMSQRKSLKNIRSNFNFYYNHKIDKEVDKYQKGLEYIKKEINNYQNEYYDESDHDIVHIASIESALNYIEQQIDFVNNKIEEKSESKFTEENVVYNKEDFRELARKRHILREKLKESYEHSMTIPMAFGMGVDSMPKRIRKAYQEYVDVNTERIKLVDEYLERRSQRVERDNRTFNTWKKKKNAILLQAATKLNQENLKYQSERLEQFYQFDHIKRLKTKVINKIKENPKRSILLGGSALVPLSVFAPATLGSMAVAASVGVVARYAGNKFFIEKTFGNREQEFGKDVEEKFSIEKFEEFVKKDLDIKHAKRRARRIVNTTGVLMAVGAGGSFGGDVISGELGDISNVDHGNAYKMDDSITIDFNDKVGGDNDFSERLADHIEVYTDKNEDVHFDSEDIIHKDVINADDNEGVLHSNSNIDNTEIGEYTEVLQNEIITGAEDGISNYVHAFSHGENISSVIFDAWKNGEFFNFVNVPDPNDISRGEFLSRMYEIIHSLDSETLKEMGVTSGDIDLIYVGQEISLNPLLEKMYPLEVDAIPMDVEVTEDIDSFDLSTEIDVDKEISTVGEVEVLPEDTLPGIQKVNVPDAFGDEMRSPLSGVNEIKPETLNVEETENVFDFVPPSESNRPIKTMEDLLKSEDFQYFFSEIIRRYSFLNASDDFFARMIIEARNIYFSNPTVSFIDVMQKVAFKEVVFEAFNLDMLSRYGNVSEMYQVVSDKTLAEMVQAEEGVITDTVHHAINSSGLNENEKESFKDLVLAIHKNAYIYHYDISKSSFSEILQKMYTDGLVNLSDDGKKVLTGDSYVNIR